jgi:CRISPR/Cas system CMR subunit Cmr6 (Cas7 group RAMP superfamily)
MVPQSSASAAAVQRAVGPLGLAVEVADPGRPTARLKPRHGRSFEAGANPLVLLRRTAFVSSSGGRDTASGGLDKTATAVALAWAARSGLGQDATHLAHVCARRTRALDRLAHDQGRHVVRLVAEPEWRLAVGIGERGNAHEIGLSLHGTHGWPILPGSGLKGLALAYARNEDPALLRAVFGWPLPGLDPGEVKAAVGGVRFLDALPDGEPPDGQPVAVHLDVLTPHVKPYYDDAIKDVSPAERRPPSEQHKPEVIQFLSVSGRFAVDLVGDDPDHVRLAERWLIEAGEELGAGAKTAAGYGYLRLSKRPLPEGGSLSEGGSPS